MYLRHRFGYLNASTEATGGGEGGGDGDEDSEVAPAAVRWYEVDHPSVVEAKANTLLPGCIPEGCKYHCAPVVGDSGVDDDAKSVSFAISIEGDMDGGGAFANANAPEEVKESPVPPYHLIGYDLRANPEELFDGILADPRHGFDRTVPTLFVLECVMMYLTESSSRELLQYLATKAVVNSVDGDGGCSHRGAFSAVLLFDPIPGRDGFGQVMLQHLRRAGITGVRDDETGEDKELSLDRTRTLSDQLSKLTECGFDVAVGCTMADAYDGGIVSKEECIRASRCEMLDELEEFVLLMRHYCLAVGVSCADDDSGGDDKSSNSPLAGEMLCFVGSDSPVGFVEGRCTVARRTEE